MFTFCTTPNRLRIVRNQDSVCYRQAIADLCRNLGVATVAERIEQEQQAVELLEMGVDLGQGYLFGRPGPSFLPAAS